MKLALLIAAAGAFAVYTTGSAGVSASDFGQPSDSFAARILWSHNLERARLGMPPLRWDARLSAQARQWAATLARSGTFRHAQSRGGAGENLWMGSSNQYSPEQMVGGFLSEGRAFRPGLFPNVSNTGNWTDVGHYTQVIWPQTRSVGCALARNGRQDVLVCRYWPAGNIYGERVG